MKDRFTIWIKNIIDKGSINPPDETWDNISKKLDIENSWNNIDKELDIDTVWNRLDHQLSQDAKMRTYEKLSYVPIIALVLLFSWLGVKNEFYKNDFKKDHSIAQVEIYDDNEMNFQNKNILPEEPKTVDLPVVKQNENYEQKTEEQDIESQKSENKFIKSEDLTIEENNAKDSRLDAKNVFTHRDQSKNKHSLPDYLNSMPGGLIVNFNSTNILAPEKIKLANDSVINESDKKQWYYGIGVSGNRTWLNDNRLKRASEGSRLYDAIATNNMSFKLNAGLEINQHWAIQADINILGNIGQSYGEYINGRYRMGEVNVNYNGIQIGIKRNLPYILNGNDLIRKQIVAGGYVNHIYQVNQTENVFISNEINQFIISDTYKNYDAGIWAGIEMFYQLNESYQIGTSLHYKYGINNIYKGNSEIPAYLRETNTSELSLSVILRRYSK
ncbi:hypothetical protein [Marivirga sp.]|uniref:hypothetical protein n=1 Tax=Marivirga sp. TaxID=2018662 RepID=UPI003DA6E157